MSAEQTVDPMPTVIGDDEPREAMREAVTSARIPDFRADELTLAEYEATIKDVVARALSSALSTVRDTHAVKKAQLEADLQAARSATHETTIAAMDAASRFAKLLKKRKKRKGRALAKPTLVEDLRTFGRAGMLYRSAVAAEKANAAAFARVREAQAQIDKHDRRLEQQVMDRESELRRFYNGDEGRASLSREPYLRQIFKRVEAIRLERLRYEARFAAGSVSAEEQREREMARDNYVFLDGDVAGAFFLGQVTYQTYRYHIIRDRDGRDWLIDYDDRNRTIEKLLFDVRKMGNGSYVVKRSAAPDRRIVGGEATLVAPDARRKIAQADPRLIAALVDFAQSFY